MHKNDIGTWIVDSAIHLHQDLGPGLLETVYEVTLAAKLRKRGLAITGQAPLKIGYEGQQFDERRHRPIRSRSLVNSSPWLRDSVRTPETPTKRLNTPTGNRPRRNVPPISPGPSQSGFLTESRRHRDA
jgi:hypothetical protein